MAKLTTHPCTACPECDDVHNSFCRKCNGDDAGREADYEVSLVPWVLSSGHAVLGLKGISGGYLLDRVVKIVRFAEEGP